MRCVILVGHGGVPSDCPATLVADFKRLESAARGKMTPELRAADEKIRRWPRTHATDPYKTGLETIVAALKSKTGCEVFPAYNEFCAPSLEEAFEGVVKAGATDVTVISTMYTRGGVHSEKELPEIMKTLQAAHPSVTARYVWPFDVDAVSAFLAGEIERARAAAQAR